MTGKTDSSGRPLVPEIERLKAVVSARIEEAGRERDEARAERDALAHVIEQVREYVRGVDEEPGLGVAQILDAAPAVSLALHDAEVLHTVADAPFVERDQDGYMPGYCECGHIDEGMVRQSLHARAAAIREEAK